MSETSRKQTICVVGTDEAGYGPNLGPLLVGASCWRLKIDVDETTFPPSRPSDAASNDSPSNRTASNRSTAQRVEKSRVSKKKSRTKEKNNVENGATLFDLFPNDSSPKNDAERLQTSPPQEFADELKNVKNEIGRSFIDRNGTDGAVRRLNESLAELSTRRGIFPLIDSKRLYGPSKSLAALERSFWLAVLLANGRDVAARREIFSNATFRTALELVARERFNVCEPRDESVPFWEKDVDFPLPADRKTGDFEKLADATSQIETTFDDNDVRLLDVAARRVQPFEFNALLDSIGLKSDLIAGVTTSLVVETIGRVAARNVENAPPIFVVLCDKLGGRDRYEPLLAARFPGANFETLVEGRAESVYRAAVRRGVARGGEEIVFPTELLVEIRFTAKGESNVPTALASIVAKYFRELSMTPFNDFWRRATNDPAFKPTAGYPLDAKRFRADVDEARTRLGIDDAAFWRKK